MLDLSVKQLLVKVFESLEKDITLLYGASEHPKQTELLEMLSEVASTSSKIHLEASQERSEVPKVEIIVSGKRTGISFLGIPGGHEFSSLVLAVLNADGKGRFPDPAFQRRIRQIKGKIRLRTYVSLSCENCPGVVQALNQMALLHPDFEHQMGDGAFFPEEIERLGIQGVPSVMAGDQLVHSGKIELIDLVDKLESLFGGNEETSQRGKEEEHLGNFDVVVLGGGPAGASAAIYSARKGLKTGILAERIGGQVQDTKGIENLISIPYTEGPQLSQHLLEHMRAYPIQVLEHRRVAAIKIEGEHRKIELEGGEFLKTDSIIIATGAKWRQLGIPGEKEYIGRGVAFCPHCDGPFYRGKSVAVVGGGNSGVEAAIDLAGIAREVVLIEYQEKLKADKVLVEKLLTLPNVTLLTSAKMKAVLGDGKKVTAIEVEMLHSGELVRRELDGVFVQIGLVPNSGFVKGVVKTSASGEIVVDSQGRTSCSRIYAAGDVTTTPYKQIIIAMGEGAKAALTSFEDRMRDGLPSVRVASPFNGVEPGNFNQKPA